MEKRRPYKVTIIAPTCFYYQAPLFRALSASPDVDLTVYFCSDEGNSGKDIKDIYGSTKNWDAADEMLAGYKFKFLRNYAPWGSYLKSLVGLANFGVLKELIRSRPHAVVVMSWMNPTWWLTVFACILSRTPYFFLTDANYYAEGLKSRWKSWLKRKFLGNLLFIGSSGFLCAGTANRKLYTFYGVPDSKLIPFAYSWGYDSLMRESKDLLGQKAELRRRFGLPQDAAVILYCGRLSPEKGVIDLLNAYETVSHPRKALVFVGDGDLRNQMQEIVDDHGIESVHFMGFQNRREMGNFFAAADILVLPSHRETWGLVVNEALCFSLPLVVSDQVGAGMDLVHPDGNGFVYPAGDVAALADRISKLLDLPQEDRLRMGEASYRLISEWMDRDLTVQLYEYLDSIYQARA